MTNTTDRRKFLVGGAIAGVAVGAVGASVLRSPPKKEETPAAPAIAKSETITLKMQSGWGGGIFQENAQSYVDRVHAMAGSAIKIDLLTVNSVVKTSQMQDAVHRGVIDAAHYVPAYWYSKSKIASLFDTGPCFGWSSQEVLGWYHYGGGMELFNELIGKLGLNLVSFFNSPMPAQPLGWFKEEITDASQMDGLKYRTVGLAAGKKRKIFTLTKIISLFLFSKRSLPCLLLIKIMKYQLNYFLTLAFYLKLKNFLLQLIHGLRALLLVQVGGLASSRPKIGKMS